MCLGSGSNWRIQSPRRGIHDNTNYVTFPSPILNCVCNLSLVTGEPASQRRHDNQHMIRPQSSCLFISLRILVHVNVIPEYLDLFVAWKVTLEIARAHLTRPSPHSPGSRKIRPRRCVCLVLSVGRRRRRDRTPNFSFCFVFFFVSLLLFLLSSTCVCVCIVVRGQEASCLRCEAVPIIGLKLPGVELATEKTDPSHCLSGKTKRIFSFFFLFSLAFIFICVYRREDGEGGCV